MTFTGLGPGNLLRILEHFSHVIVIDDGNITNTLFNCFDLSSVITLGLTCEIVS